MEADPALLRMRFPPFPLSEHASRHLCCLRYFTKLNERRIFGALGRPSCVKHDRLVVAAMWNGLRRPGDVFSFAWLGSRLPGVHSLKTPGRQSLIRGRHLHTLLTALRWALGSILRVRHTVGTNAARANCFLTSRGASERKNSKREVLAALSKQPARLCTAGTGKRFISIAISPPGALIGT